MLEPAQCHVPPKSIRDDADALGGNRCYEDLRYLDWTAVRFYLTLEDQLLALIASAENGPNADADDENEGSEDVAERVVDEFLEGQNQSEMDLVGLLDFGVYSCVAALSACSCIPVASCNGGEFGGVHHEVHPVVAFHARPSRCSLLNAAAQQANVRIWHNDKTAAVGSPDIDGLRRFARALLHLHPKIKVDKPMPRSAPQLKTPDSQLDLGLETT